MFPPSSPTPISQIDLSTLSGITGSISIACWIVVFSPQIIENFRRRSADGLSVTFIIIWLLGDVFNIVGAVLQGVLPTMVILAVYYTLADVVLLGQVWWYRGFVWGDADVKKTTAGGGGGGDEENGERQPLLGSENGNGSLQHGNGQNGNGGLNGATIRQFENRERRSSSLSAFRRHLSMDGMHLSPATPLLDTPKHVSKNTKTTQQPPPSTIRKFLLNTFAVFLVCAAGILGWYFSQSSSSSSSSEHRHDHHHKHHIKEPLHFDLIGQISGYLCALLYLLSRLPQLLLNYRRKSTEGVSLLFFLFACIGNLTYDMSIFAYDPTPSCRGSFHTEIDSPRCAPGEASAIYRRYIAVNASWIAGSLGTLILDLIIFAQFFWYGSNEDGSNNNNGSGILEEEAIVDSDTDDEIPQR